MENEGISFGDLPPNLPHFSVELGSENGILPSKSGLNWLIVLWRGCSEGSVRNEVDVFLLKFWLCVQLLVFDTVTTFLTPKNGERSFLLVPPSTIAGAAAGVYSTLTMYPLELLKTRLTVEVLWCSHVT